MAEEHTVTNATLYSLLQKAYSLLDTVHANQTKTIIPDFGMLAESVAALALAKDVAALANILAALRSDLDSKIALLDAKLDQIGAQVTPPETGDFNP
jgi:hypothetical protein